MSPSSICFGTNFCSFSPVRPPSNQQSNTIGCCGGPDSETCSPANWQFLSTEAMKSCNAFQVNGKWVNQQSPINMDMGEEDYEKRTSAEGKLFFSKGKCTGEMVRRPGTWEMEILDNCATEATVTVDGETWKLWQVQVHGPSEHAVNGMYFPIELQMVHIPEGESPATATRGLMLSVMLTPGKSNSIFNIFTQSSASSTGSVAKSFNPYELLPSDKAYWQYTGSLTTPALGGAKLGCQLRADSASWNPSTNNIKWLVFKKPVLVGVGQLTWLTDYLCTLPLAFLCENSRFLQIITPDTTLSTFGKTISATKEIPSGLNGGIQKPVRSL